MEITAWIRNLFMACHLKTVAYAIDRLNIRILFRHFASELFYYCVYGADASVIIKAPYGIKDRLPGKYHIFILDKMQEQIKLFWRGI